MHFCNVESVKVLFFYFCVKFNQIFDILGIANSNVESMDLVQALIYANVLVSFGFS